MAEETIEKSRRERTLERLKAKYPDREYADDEALFGQIDDDYDAYDKEIGAYKERESKLNDLLAKDPRNAQFIADMAKGKNPWLSLIKRVGIDGITDLMNNPEKQAEFAEADKEYVERLAKEKGLAEEYEANFAQSMQMLEQMQAEQGLSDEEIDAAMELVMTMTNDAIVGKFSRETLDMALKALKHDSNVAAARGEGEIAGRNAKIDEELRKPKAGDGLPAIGGTNNAPTRKNAAPQTIFDIYRGED